MAVDAPASTKLAGINIDSAASILTGEWSPSAGDVSTLQHVTACGSKNNDGNIFVACFDGSFGSVSFGNVAQTGLSETFVRDDLTVLGYFNGGSRLGDVDLIYVPEPSTLLLATMGLVAPLAFSVRHRKRASLYLLLAALLAAPISSAHATLLPFGVSERRADVDLLRSDNRGNCRRCSGRCGVDLDQHRLGGMDFHRRTGLDLERVW